METMYSRKYLKWPLWQSVVAQNGTQLPAGHGCEGCISMLAEVLILSESLYHFLGSVTEQSPCPTDHWLFLWRVLQAKLGTNDWFSDVQILFSQSPIGDLAVRQGQLTHLSRKGFASSTHKTSWDRFRKLSRKQWLELFLITVF